MSFIQSAPHRRFFCVCVLLVNEFTVFFEEKFEVSELRCMADHALDVH